jgi:hypothetical protein
MNLMIYLLQANIYLLLFFLFYVVFLRRETFFNWNRIYLVGTALLAFIIPVINFDGIKKLLFDERIVEVKHQFHQVINDSYENPIQLSVTPATPEQATISLGSLLFYLYLSGAVLFLIRFCWKFFQLQKAIQQETVNQAFSFFNILWYYPTTTQ